MKLERCLKELTKRDEIKSRDADMKFILIFTHDERNAIGTMPYVKDDNSPLRTFEYLVQGFAREAEILLMAKTLSIIKADGGQEFYDKCRQIMLDKQYPYYKEVIDQLIEGLEEDNEEVKPDESSYS